MREHLHDGIKLKYLRNKTKQMAITINILLKNRRKNKGIIRFFKVLYSHLNREVNCERYTYRPEIKEVKLRGGLLNFASISSSSTLYFLH